MYLNRVFLVGNLGKAPEFFDTKAGNRVASFNLATTTYFLDQKSKQMLQSTEWHRIACYNERVVNTAASLSKGSYVMVEGAVRVRSWADPKTNQTRTSIEVQAESIFLLQRQHPGTQAELTGTQGYPHQQGSRLENGQQFQPNYPQQQSHQTWATATSDFNAHGFGTQDPQSHQTNRPSSISFPKPLNFAPQNQFNSGFHNGDGSGLKIQRHFASGNHQGHPQGQGQDQSPQQYQFGFTGDPTKN